MSAASPPGPAARATPTRRRFCATALARGLTLPLAGSLLALAGCDPLVDGRSIHVDRARIESALARRFPYRTRWLGLFDVTAQQPVLQLLPERNRIGAEVDLLLKARLFDHDLKGVVGFDGALRYDAATASLKLVDVQIVRVALAGLPEAAAGQASRLGALLAEQLLEGLELYQLTDAQREELRRRGVRPGAVTVTADGLEVTLEAAGSP